MYYSSCILRFSGLTIQVKGRAAIRLKSINTSAIGRLRTPDIAELLAEKTQSIRYSILVGNECFL